MKDRNFKNLEILLKDGGKTNASIDPTSPAIDVKIVDSGLGSAVDPHVDYSSDLLADLLNYLSPLPANSNAVSPLELTKSATVDDESSVWHELELPDDIKFPDFHLKSDLFSGRIPESQESFEITPGYSSLRNLSTGSFGKVFLARHLLSDQLVAIKRLTKAELKSSESSNRVLHELMIHKSLHHPYICPLLEVLDSSRYIYLVTQYCPHGEMFDFVEKRGKLDSATARKYFRQLVDAVGYLHKRGIVHRDLKLENMLLDANDNLQIIDFGFAGVVQQDLLMKTDCGSPEYAAPETITGNSYRGPPVDIWSMGVILYAMITGQLPFHAEKISKTFSNIASINYSWPFEVETELKELMLRIFTSDVKRLSIDEIATHPWVMKGHESVPLGSTVTEPPAELCAAVKMQMSRDLGVVVDDDLLNGEPTAIMATYNLLLKKLQAETPVGENTMPRLVQPMQDFDNREKTVFVVEKAGDNNGSYVDDDELCRKIQSLSVLKRFSDSRES